MYDTIIIGAGMAGLASAIYASRKKMKFEIISKEFGGNLMFSGEILNYPGVPKATGPEFRSIMERQMELNGIRVIEETVKAMEKSGGGFRVIAGKKTYDTKTIIIATGSIPRKLGIPGEEEFAMKGVTYCSVCDGPLFAGMDVAIVGGSNSALMAADSMKNIASRIYMIVRDDRLTGHEYLIENAKKNPKVKMIFNSEAKEITGEKLVSGIRYVQLGREKELKVKGVIIEIGKVPNTGLFRDLVNLDEHGHILIDCQCHTSVPGIFAAGDCASGHEYQYAISAGQGAMALLKAAAYIAEREGG